MAVEGVSRRAALAGAAAASASRAWAAEGFDDEVRRRMADAKIPGLGVGHAQDGRVRLARGYGFADLAARRPVGPDTPFHVASISKAVVATAVVALAADGRLDLDGPVAPHLDFPLAPASRPVTFRHLLRHVSGVSDAAYYRIDFRRQGADADQPLGDFLRAYLSPDGEVFRQGGCLSEAAPGSTWDYSNVGFGLLGYAAGRAVGQDLRRVIQRRLLDRVGVTSAAWTLAAARGLATPYELADGALRPVPPVAFPDWPAGMLHISIRDFIRFAAAVSDAGDGLVPATATADMLKMARPAGLPDWLTGQGLGWMEAPLDGRPLPNHWGGDPGVFTMTYLDPATRSAVAIFANTDATPEVRVAMKALAARLLAQGRPA